MTWRHQCLCTVAGPMEHDQKEGLKVHPCWEGQSSQFACYCWFPLLASREREVEI